MSRASAPGKIVLSGEYAVLDGAPAICMAVDRRAQVTIGDSGSDCHTVTAAGYTDVEGRFTSAGGATSWLQGRDEFALVDAAWQAIEPAPGAGLALALDTRQFQATGGAKLGLGSSAALTVALVAALLKHLGLQRDVAEPAHRAHRLLQGGKGSGVDIACSTRGGLIEYRVQGGTASLLEWPDGLHRATLWSGVAASTAEKIGRFADMSPLASREALAVASGVMAGAWRRGDRDAVLREYRNYCEALLRFSVDHDLGIFDAGHDLVADAAEREGLVYKPCGAGGGDVGIILGAEASAVRAFANDAGRYGFSVLDADLDTDGVTTD